MRTVWLVVILIGVIALPALVQDKEQDRVGNAGRVMQEIMNIPDDIPQSVIDKADCVVVLPSVVKFAFGIGGSYGRGVMTCRGGKDFQGPWGAPSMMALEGGSFDLQWGAVPSHAENLWILTTADQVTPSSLITSAKRKSPEGL